MAAKKPAAVLKKQAAKNKKTEVKMMTVAVRPGQSVVVTANPKATDYGSPFFYRWAEMCNKKPSEVWVMPTKHHPRCRRSPRWCACPANEIRIGDMHTMQLVNAIKWCIRQADRAITGSLFSNFDVSRAQLLAMVPQWGELLIEAGKRDLKIVGKNQYLNINLGAPVNADWYDKAMLAIGLRALERKKPGQL